MTKGKSKQEGESKKPRSGYDRAAVMETVCAGLSKGRALARILDEEEGMPPYGTFMRWLTEDETLRDNYTRAREDSADWLADEIVHIADTETDPQIARVRIDARKWVAGKMKPKKYGDKLEVSGDADNPLQLKITRVELVALGDGTD